MDMQVSQIQLVSNIHIIHYTIYTYYTYYTIYNIHIFTYESDTQYAYFKNIYIFPMLEFT